MRFQSLGNLVMFGGRILKLETKTLKFLKLKGF